MKKQLIIILLLIVLLAGGAYYLSMQNESSSENNMMDDKDTTTKMEENEKDLSFDHMTLNNEYVLEDLKVSENNESSLESGYLLIKQVDQEELDRSDSGREGPPTMNIYVFDAEGKDIRGWLASMANFSNYAGQDLVSVNVGGQEALQYEWEGLYKGRNIVVKKDGKIYLFVATYTDVSDGRLEDFDQLLRTVEFTK